MADGIAAIDTLMAGRERITSAYLLEGDEPALVETGPTTSVAAVLEGLTRAGMAAGDLAHVVVTHIHLDHAGGVGTLSRTFDRATIWVHDRGAPHLADPSRLVRSVARVYGEQLMRALFGPVEAVDASRIRAVKDGDSIALSGRTLDVIYTPGHASHHVALADSLTGAVFTGDALGIHLPDVGVLRPATPPPEIDVERAVESIERIRERAGPMLMFSHYGPVSQADELCELASRRLRAWADAVRDAMAETADLERIAEILDRRTAGEFDEAPQAEDAAALAAVRDRYETLSSMRMNAAGLVRYWEEQGRREAEPAERRD